MINPKALDALYATLSDIEAANKPVEVTEEPKPVVSVEEIAKTNTEPLSSEKPDNLFNDFRNYLLSVLASNEQQQLDDTIAKSKPKKKGDTFSLSSTSQKEADYLSKKY